MKSTVLTASVIGFAVFLVTWVLSSFVLNPEDILGRLVLYVVGILAFLAAVVLLIVGLVRRARARKP